MLCEGYQLYLDFIVVISAESRIWRMLGFSVLAPLIIVAGDLRRLSMSLDVARC
jgi:hypothetical protein